MITEGIQNSMGEKNRLVKKYIKCNDYNKKIFFIKNIKKTGTAYQLYWGKIKNIVITISRTTLIISKTHGKELRIWISENNS